MDSESFVKEKLKEYKEKRAAVAVMIKDLQDKVKEFKEVNVKVYCKNEAQLIGWVVLLE